MPLKKALISLTRLMKGNTKQRECYSIMTLRRATIYLMSVKALKCNVSSVKSSIVTTSLLCSILTGCYQQPQLPLTQKVYIPTKCITTIPPPPHLTGDVVKSVILLQRSYLELRLLLTECISQGDQDAKK